MDFGPIPESAVLNPGDTVWLRCKLIDYGTWVVAYQIGHIEDALERDGRLDLLGYETEERADGYYITFEVKVRQTPRETATVQKAGIIGAVITVVAVVGLLTYGSAWTWFYYNDMEYKIEAQRVLQDIATDPNATEAERVAAIEALGADESFTDKVTVSVTAMVIAAVVMYFLTRG